MFQKHSNSLQELIENNYYVSQLILDRRSSGPKELCQLRQLKIFLLADDLSLYENAGRAIVFFFLKRVL